MKKNLQLARAEKHTIIRVIKKSGVTTLRSPLEANKRRLANLLSGILQEDLCIK